MLPPSRVSFAPRAGCVCLVPGGGVLFVCGRAGVLCGRAGWCVVVFVCRVWRGCSCALLCLFVLVCVPSRLVGVGLCWLCCLVFVCAVSFSRFSAWLFFEHAGFSRVWRGFLAFRPFLFAAR